MDPSDAEMTEAGVAATRPHQPAGDGVRELLALARQHINEGKPSQALQAVLMATRTRGGEQAVVESLNRARELYRTRLQESVAADQLASLFAECVIEEAQPLNPEHVQVDIVGPPSARPPPPVHENSILAESGRMQIVSDAFSDGSSFICLKCGGLVSNHRKEEHFAYWCCNI